MAIFEEKILITINSTTMKYYEDLGYDVPRKKDKKGRFTVPRGTAILVNIKDLLENSNEKVTKICDICGEYIQNQYYFNIIRKRKKGDGKDRCFSCTRINAGHKRKNNVKFENSLYSFAIKLNKEYLVEEFSSKNHKSSTEISFGTKDEYLWDCPDCKSEYTMPITNRVNGQNCPFCSGRRVNHTNCLWATHPQIAKLLVDKSIGYDFSSGSNFLTQFKCKYCSYEKTMQINTVVKQGLSCPRCSDGVSYPEKFMMNVLDQLNIAYETQKTFEWSNLKKYDFYISKLDLIIETHGEQHFTERGYYKLGNARTFIEETNNDEYKIKLAKINSIGNYVVIDCRESNWAYIKESIINSKLKSIIDLEKVDFLKCHESACKSLVKTVCELWNKGNISTSKIGKIVNLERNTVRRYLLQGKEIGWTDYSPNLARTINAKQGNKFKKQVVQLTKTGEFIKQWQSISEAGNALNISISHISSCCKGNPRCKSVGGFVWIYKEEYEKI